MVSDLILRLDCGSATFEWVDWGSVTGGLTGVLCLSEIESKSSFFLGICEALYDIVQRAG